VTGPSTQPVLRPATAADAAFLHAVYENGRTDELAAVPWTPEQKANFLRSQSEAQLLYYREQYPTAVFWVVSVDGTDVGRIFTDERAEDLRLMDMGLLPEYRNQGIGTQLLEGVIARGRELGLPVVLHVESFNPAKALYERFGFIDDGEVGAYRRMILPREGAE
jgi:ribosomal protein S18 acetylase RimI-like enzyme